MTGWITQVVGAVVEAWAELRVNRMRVLLSLVGVAVAVACLSGVVAAGGIAGQASREASERASGRPPTYGVQALVNDTDHFDSSTVTRAFHDVIDRHHIGQASSLTRGQTDVQLPFGVTRVDVSFVDRPYAELHRLIVAQGRWFVDADAERLAPAVVVNEAMFTQLGAVDLSSHPVLHLRGAEPTTAVVVGVLKTTERDTTPTIYSLPQADDAPSIVVGDTDDGAMPTYEMWLPSEISEELASVVAADMQTALGGGVSMDVFRKDYLGGDAIDPYRMLTLIIGGVAALILLLGGLGLINVSLVTVQQRIREIGIRRAFGATAPRVFATVVLESVAGTAVAGFAGVMAAVFAVSNPWVRDRLAQGGAVDLPGFPLEAAFLGLGAAVAVGALAGIVPALVAVRVRVIDAIRT